MTPSLKPGQWLLLLLAVAAGVFGWVYGLNWRRIATGADTTHQERMLIDLQDQVTELRKENERLLALLREKEGESGETGGPKPSAEPPTVAP